ncbi:GATA transcription factor 5-like [Cornus florida]|uniref:GATA transcription factor 5-like n=1 Tax=Cornus florida TaxID=4283 RepID=UPI00289E5F98|nr:GATA transcription factor 5-like [Cornus florida]
MLHPTHHHPSLFFTINPFTSSPFPPHSTTTTAATKPSSSQPIQAEQGMEALKSSFRPEMAVKAAATNHQACLDDLWMANGQNGVVSGDDFFVDDLLDFSEEGLVEEEEQEDHKQQDNKPCCLSISSPKLQSPKAEKVQPFDSVKDDFGSVPGSELSVPADDLADLEWLSHFVEDSFSLTFPAEKLTQGRSEKETPVSDKPCFATPVQTKARSKRVRAGGRVWSLGSPSLTESSSSSSASSSSTLSSPSNPWLIYTGQTHTAESFLGKPPAKKQKKKSPEASAAGGGGVMGQFPRRCSHCLVQKTPQWRAGPLGAKTLCNACGVRYKSGRLLPEYRPACSPTFSSEVHSNNHRKVLEMRRKKESATGLGPPVQSF